jgi:hypothetical protein
MKQSIVQDYISLFFVATTMSVAAKKTTDYDNH